MVMDQIMLPQPMVEKAGPRVLVVMVVAREPVHTVSRDIPVVLVLVVLVDHIMQVELEEEEEEEEIMVVVVAHQMAPAEVAAPVTQLE